jgi:hypothetical protein
MISHILHFKNTNQDKRRLDWDEYFMSIALLASVELYDVVKDIPEPPDASE